jgi:hypothetical protein
VDVVVLADTHLKGGLELPGALRAALADADVVLHAGDVTSALALEQLCSSVPTHAVLGNNDHALVGALPGSQLVELDGVRVGMVHDSGAARGRAARLKRMFPQADVVVFGHSHVPIDEVGIGGQILFNPGSPTQRRAQPWRTFGRLRIAGHVVTTRSIETLGD